MRTLMLPALALVILLVAGCAQSLAERGRALVETYCLNTSPPERELMRLQMSTEKGPLLTVHCENLEADVEAGDDPGAPVS